MLRGHGPRRAGQDRLVKAVTHVLAQLRAQTQGGQATSPKALGRAMARLGSTVMKSAAALQSKEGASADLGAKRPVSYLLRQVRNSCPSIISVTIEADNIHKPSLLGHTACVRTASADPAGVTVASDDTVMLRRVDSLTSCWYDRDTNTTDAT
jgi:hypothetical protein